MSIQRVSDRVRQFQAGASVKDQLAYGLSRRDEDVDALAEDVEDLLKRYPSIGHLRNLSAVDLIDLGFTEEEAHRRLALLRVGQVIAMGGPGALFSADSPQSIADRFSWLRDERREYFYVLLVNTRLSIVMERAISIGTLNMSLVSPREVYREAIREGAYGIICLHNHPSGDPTPSPEDIQVTESLKKSGAILDIELIDHIIVGDPGYYSFRERRIL